MKAAYSQLAGTSYDLNNLHQLSVGKNTRLAKLTGINEIQSSFNKNSSIELDE